MTRIVFMGTPDFSVPVLNTLIKDGYDVVGVVTQPDRPKGRKKVMTPPPVKEEALRHGIPVLQPERVRVEEETDRILQLEPDLIVTAAFGQILPKKLLDYPKYGCINVHASLLPELRGGAPIHYAILEGKQKTGVTIMYMVEKLDAGDMLSKVEVDIEEDDNVGTLHDKLSQAGAALLSETVLKVINGSVSPEKQDEEKATYAPNIKREQERIDWSKPGEVLYNQVRGLNPWPVAYTMLGGKTLKVWAAKKTSAGKQGEPGEIIAVEKDGIVVATGNSTALKLTEVQPAGKKRMRGEDFVRGAGLQTGMKLGYVDEEK
ncbi:MULTISPECIES: methionyl-tRNA formyltransferase [unclassified Bacillus (in: firmicutes)]|uniref:methionyl-tRNA formyltransferase n=1 Tax=unclassified Bacillus (in: firmicutes) TaxID=185979 RepID=UPI000429C52A|nr:methionyl-tRNA formyltransferase [Bacillus sp. NSP9.1]QHZ46754.1 methionyl-tRNA formyltransferase [Bacillus sp. NSP9.1]